MCMQYGAIISKCSMLKMISTYGYLNAGLGLDKHEEMTAVEVSKNTETRARI